MKEVTKNNLNKEKSVVLTKTKKKSQEVKPDPKKEQANKTVGPKKDLITEVKAKARFIRTSPTKARLIVNYLRGKSADDTLNYLKFVHKAAVSPIAKLINSAVANAEKNFSLNRDDLYIKKFIVNDGPILKRYQPKAYGRSAQISKRTSHFELILGLRPGAKPGTIKSVKKAEVKNEEQDLKTVAPTEIKKEGPKVTGRGPDEKGRSQQG